MCQLGLLNQGSNSSPIIWICLNSVTLTAHSCHTWATLLLGLAHSTVISSLGLSTAEIVETTLVFSWFHFLRVGSWISKLCVIILPGTQILKFVSRIPDCSPFRFSFLKINVAPSCIARPGATRIEKKRLLGNYPIRNYYLEFISDLIG